MRKNLRLLLATALIAICFTNEALAERRRSVVGRVVTGVAVDAAISAGARHGARALVQSVRERSNASNQSRQENNQYLSHSQAPYQPRVIRNHLENAHGISNVSSSTIARPGSPNGRASFRIVEFGGNQVRITFNERGFPIFDDHAVYDTRLRNFDRSAGRTNDMKRATRALNDSITKGEIPETRFTSDQLNAIRSGSSVIPEYTWHHHEDVGRMQLVPRELHRLVKHVGGSSVNGKAR